MEASSPGRACLDIGSAQLKFSQDLLQLSWDLKSLYPIVVVL